MKRQQPNLIRFSCFPIPSQVDMTIIETPPSREWYASYVIVVSGNSQRHLYAMATAVAKAVCWALDGQGRLCVWVCSRACVSFLVSFTRIYVTPLPTLVQRGTR